MIRIESKNTLLSQCGRFIEFTMTVLMTESPLWLYETGRPWRLDGPEVKNEFQSRNGKAFANNLFRSSHLIKDHSNWLKSPVPFWVVHFKEHDRPPSPCFAVHFRCKSLKMPNIIHLGCKGCTSAKKTETNRRSGVKEERL